MYLIDTDIMVFFLRGRTDVVEKFRQHQNSPKAMSIITWGELLYGARKSNDPDAKTAKVRRVAETIPLLEVTRSVVETFAELKAGLEEDGVRVDDFDLLIGSTALVHNLTVVTNNQRHFEKIPGVDIENWKKQ